MVVERDATMAAALQRRFGNGNGIVVADAIQARAALGKGIPDKSVVVAAWPCLSSPEPVAGRRMTLLRGFMLDSPKRAFDEYTRVQRVPF